MQYSTMLRSSIVQQKANQNLALQWDSEKRGAVSVLKATGGGSHE